MQECGSIRNVKESTRVLKDGQIEVKNSGKRVTQSEVESPKSTKVRLVVSLNDALEKAHCLLNSLFRVLLGWREEEIAFVGDSERMFNQIAVDPDDQMRNIIGS